MKDQKLDQIISQKVNRTKPTPLQKQILRNLMTAEILMPSTNDLIKAFNLDTTRQTVSQDSKKLRKHMEEEEHV